MLICRWKISIYSFGAASGRPLAKKESMGNTPNASEKSLKNWLEGLLPPELIEKHARASGFLVRKRKIDPVCFVFMLLFGLSIHAQPTMHEIHRRYVRFHEIKIFSQSLRKRFSSKSVEFLRLILLDCIDQCAAVSSARLTERYRQFKTIFIQDSSVVRLHAKLADRYPATRSKKVAAGVKISLLYNAVLHGPHSLSIVPERTHDVKTLRIGNWVKGTLLLMDLGYYKHWLFAKILDNGGSFVVRLKQSVSPTVVSLNWSKYPLKEKIPKGITLRELLKNLPQEGIYDFNVNIPFYRRTYKKRRTKELMELRVVCIWNEEKAKWHIYLTNLANEQFSAEEIYQLYRFRWEIELLFKEMKSDYQLGKLLSSKDPIAMTHIYAAIIRTVISKCIYKNMILCDEATERQQYSPHLWGRVFTEFISELLNLMRIDYFGQGDTTAEWNRSFRTLQSLSKKSWSRPTLLSGIISY